MCYWDYLLYSINYICSCLFIQQTCVLLKMTKRVAYALYRRLIMHDGKLKMLYNRSYKVHT